MRFKEFLQEASYRQDISDEKAVELIKEHCKDALDHADKPMWRGFSGKESAYLIDPASGGRGSRNTSNHYTVILDHFLPEHGYPRRSQSIICTNNAGDYYADSYGHVYALFPYDGVKMGVTASRDLWETPAFAMGKSTRKRGIEQWNEWMKRYGIRDGSYELLVHDIKEAMDASLDVAAVFGSPEEVEDVLRDAYSPENLEFSLADSKNIMEYEDLSREVWFSGKCVALSRETWHRLLRDGELK